METIPERVIRIRRDQNISTKQAFYIAQFESRFERRKQEMKAEKEKNDESN